MNILITGTSSGIGLGLAKFYLQSGNFVTGISRTKSQTLSGYDRFKELNVDLSEPSTFSFIPAADYDLVIFAAGANLTKKFTTYTVDETTSLITLNYLSTLNIVKHLILSSSTSFKCRFVYLSSIWAQIACTHRAVYGSSKAAVDSMFRHLSHEYRDLHSFLSLQLGFVDTPLTSLTKSDPLLVNTLSRSLLLSHKYTIDQVVRYISFMANPENPIFSVVSPVDGGIYS